MAEFEPPGLAKIFSSDIQSVTLNYHTPRLMKLNLGQYSEARFGPDFNSSFSRDADVWLRF